MIETITKLIKEFAVPVYEKTGFWGAVGVAVLIVAVVVGVSYMGWK